MCLCSSARPHPLSSPPELPGTFSVLRLGGPDPQLSTKIVGETISNGNPHIPRALLVAKASEALQREAKLSLFLPPFLQVLAPLKDQSLAPFPTRAEKAPRRRWPSRSCAVSVSAPCPVFSIASGPPSSGAVGEALSHVASFPLASRPVTAPGLWGHHLALTQQQKFGFLKVKYKLTQ